MDNRLITISSGHLKVTFSSLGASIVSIYFDDTLMNMVPINLEDLKRSDIYYGKTIGPISNRLKDGLIEINNKEYHLPMNEEGISNHSGLLGLSNKLFVSKVLDNRVIFTFNQKINDVNIIYGISYTVSDEQIRIDYVVRTSDTFIISLTNHTFFTLGESSLDNLSLKISSSRYIESDKESLLPLEEKDIDEFLDFNNEKPLIKDIDKFNNHKAQGYDHSFLLKDNKEIYLKSPKYRLDICSDYSNVHIYTDNYTDNVKTKNSNLTKRRAVAIECVDNYLNRPIINKDDVYQRYIIFKFSKNYL